MSNQYFIDATSWTEADDDTLMEAMANGLSFAKAAALVNRTRGAAQARFRTLAARIGWQAA